MEEQTQAFKIQPTVSIQISVVVLLQQFQKIQGSDAILTWGNALQNLICKRINKACAKTNA